MDDVLDANPWLFEQGRVSEDKTFVLIRPGEKITFSADDPSNSITFFDDTISQWAESQGLSSSEANALALDYTNLDLTGLGSSAADSGWGSSDLYDAITNDSALTSGMTNGVVGKAVGNTSFTSGFGFMGDFGQGLQNSYDFEPYGYTGALRTFGISPGSGFVNDVVSKTVNSGGGSYDGFGSSAAGIAAMTLAA